MTLSDRLLQLYEYNVWTNKQICNRLKELPKDVYRQEVKSVFSSISNALAHIYLSNLGWIEVYLMKTSVSELMPHVVNHGTYHRGNITVMLRQIGYASITTDYGLYLYLKTKGQ